MRYILLLLILVACKTQKTPEPVGAGVWVQPTFHTLPGKDPYWPEECADRSGTYLETSATEWPKGSVVGGFSSDSIEINVDGKPYKLTARESRGIELGPDDTLITVSGGCDMGYYGDIYADLLTESGRELWLAAQGFEPGMTSYIRPVDSPSFKWKSMTFSLDMLPTPNKVCTRTDSLFIRH